MARDYTKYAVEDFSSISPTGLKLNKKCENKNE